MPCKRVTERIALKYAVRMLHEFPGEELEMGKDQENFYRRETL